jgi:hypothetical protein
VWVGYSVPPHAGDEYAAAILGTLVFLYGGLVFIRPTGFERADAINIRIPVEGAEIGLIAAGA